MLKRPSRYVVKKTLDSSIFQEQVLLQTAAHVPAYVSFTVYTDRFGLYIGSFSAPVLLSKPFSALYA